MAHSLEILHENCNFFRVTKLLIDGGTQVLRDVFDKVHPPADLRKHLIDPGNHKILKNLLTKKILNKKQWDKLYPPGGTKVDSKSFDLTLLCLLLRSLCNLPTPAAGWNDPPLPTSSNVEDDVVRLRLYRNELYAHHPQPAFSEVEFTNHWDNISKVLVRLGGPKYQSEVDKIKVTSMDPEVDNYYFQCLEDWYQNETILKAVKATEKKLMKAVEAHY